MKLKSDLSPHAQNKYIKCSKTYQKNQKRLVLIKHAKTNYRTHTQTLTLIDIFVNARKLFNQFMASRGRKFSMLAVAHHKKCHRMNKSNINLPSPQHCDQILL